jgi:16S rRNA processing protein RimM
MQLSGIGYFSKTHGIKGHLILREDQTLFTEGLKTFFIETSTGKAPYFVTELRDTIQGLMVKLEEVDSVETAKKLVGKPVFVETKFVDVKEESDDWKGFELIDKEHGSLGIVTGSSTNGSQDLLSFEYRGREVILPLAEEFIEKIDEATKKIWFNAPDGLIDIYLEE